MTTTATLAPSPINLPWPLSGWLEQSIAAQLAAPGLPKLDLTRPKGEAALVPADSISWRIFKNPVSLFIGGVGAVILELAEPRVRSGVWDHTSFRTDPLTRLRRTGAAAMITVYGARSQAEAMIGGVVRRHGNVTGVTPAGVAYNANDAVLLDWVQATASYGFIESYSRFARPLSRTDEDRAYAEAVDGAALYGAMNSPSSRAELDAQFEAMRPHLEDSPIVHEFLDIIQRAPVLPLVLKPVQSMLVRAAIDMLPQWSKTLLHLEDAALGPVERALVRRAASFADRVVIPKSPAAQACARLGLPQDHVYKPVIPGRA